MCGTYVVQGRALTAVRGQADGLVLLARCQQAWLQRKGLAVADVVARPPPRRHRRGRPAPLRARVLRQQRRQHQHPLRDGPRAHDAEERVEGLHDARHDGRRGSRREESLRRPRGLVRAADAPRGVPAAARREGGRARASAARDRVCRRRRPAGPRRARRSRSARSAASRLSTTPRRRRRSCPRPCGSTSRRTTACCWRITAR